MFDIGFWELVVVAVLALIVAGPERLPAMTRKAGLWVGRGKAMLRQLRDEFEREVDAAEARDNPSDTSADGKEDRS